MYYQNLNDCGVWLTEAACLFDAFDKEDNEAEKEILREELDRALEESHRLINSATTELKHLSSSVEYAGYY